MAENRDDAMLVDALVRFVAEKVAQEGEISLEAAIDRVWALFMSGELELVPSADGEQLSFALPSGTSRAERQAVARQNKRIVQARRRR
jgi:hypothetical protein